MNRYLTKASLSVIKKLQASTDGELTWERGAGWWIDSSRVAAGPCNHLLRLCLIREAYNDNSSTYIVYQLSSEIDHVLADHNYEPAILKGTRTGKPQMIPRRKP